MYVPFSGIRRSVHDVVVFFVYSLRALPIPDFSITLNRGSFEAQEGSRYDPNLGYIAFGGYPPIPTVSPTVTVPWRGYTINSRGSGFFYYVRTQANLSAISLYLNELVSTKIVRLHKSTNTHSQAHLLSSRRA